MENHIVLIIAVEKYHDSKNLNTVLFAKNDAEAFRNSLINLGCKEDNITYLYDDLATKTTIDEKIREISKYAAENETIIFYYAGHGFYYNNKNLIACVDTSKSSLDTTTVALNSILAAFDNSKCKKVIAFLDCCHSGIEFSEVERSPVSDFSIDELKYEYKNAEHLTVFASCKSDEKSQADSERKHGAWSYYLIQALSGKAKEIYDSEILFSDKLQKYLSENTSHRVKKITPEKKNQTPVKFGKESADKFIVADLTKIFAEEKVKMRIDGIRFENATILTKDDQPVKDLPGFKSNHKVPKEVSSYHDNWIKTISRELIEDELNDIAIKLKEKLKYKRKDIEKPLIYDGAGQLITIDFDYIVSVEQSKASAETYIITRSIENFKNSNILNNPEFNELFNEMFDELEFWFSKKLNVESIIDKIEDIDNADLINVKYDTIDTSFCTIRINDFEGKILLTEKSFKIKSKKKNSPQNLILSCQNVYERLSEKGIKNLLLL